MKHSILQSAAKLRLSVMKVVAMLLLTVLIVMPEELFDHVLELTHLCYESISYLLEEFLQHYFHADKYTSQSIVFYLWLSAALTCCYYLWRRIPILFRHCVVRLDGLRKNIGEAVADCWNNVTLSQKIKWIAAGGTILYLLSNFFM
ncbi:MAG: hypothetical protein ACU84J_11365 [Gammaproteobacteria bacterium]